MNFIIKPWHILVATLAGWVNHRQQDVIDFLRTENQILKEKLGKRRILLSDDQRRRLALKGKVLGRKLLAEISTIFTPDTILRWHQTLIAQKWNFSDRRTQMGRPPTSKETQGLVVRMVRENPSWGYDRLQGALANLGHDISDTTVGNILRAHGIEPAPKRRLTSNWKTFLKAHWDVLAAIDFTTIEVNGSSPFPPSFPKAFAAVSRTASGFSSRSSWMSWGTADLERCPILPRIVATSL